MSRALFFGLGCLFTTVFEPAGLWPLALVLLLPFLYVCLTLPARAATEHGFCFGLGLFLCGTYWIYLSVTGPGQAAWWIGVVLVVLLTLIMACYLALTAWLINRFARDRPWRLLLVAPAAWTGIEWLRGWLFSGFPWMSLGYGQIDTALAGFAPVFGVYGMSLVLVLCSAATLIAILQRGRARWLAAGSCAAAVVARCRSEPGRVDGGQRRAAARDHDPGGHSAGTQVAGRAARAHQGVLLREHGRRRGQRTRGVARSRHPVCHRS